MTTSSTSGGKTRRATYREVGSENAGQRLDNYLLACLKGVPRSHIYRLVRSGQVRVNSGRVRPAYRVKHGDRIRIPPLTVPDSKPPTANPRSLAWLEERVVYEDDRLIIVDKPAGMAVHGGSGVNIGCVEAFRVLRPKSSTLELVHRLDKATSGCLLLAKRRSALRSLHRLLREENVEKHYFALVKGVWPSGEHVVDYPLRVYRAEAKRRVGVSADGKLAVSYFRAIERFGDVATLVDVRIATGRTHQIRVHASAAHHPVAGDERYGDADFDDRMASFGLRRMFLHAASITFEYPAPGSRFGICVPLPAQLASMLSRLGEQFTPSKR